MYLLSKLYIVNIYPKYYETLKELKLLFLWNTSIIDMIEDISRIYRNINDTNEGYSFEQHRIANKRKTSMEFIYYYNEGRLNYNFSEIYNLIASSNEHSSFVILPILLQKDYSDQNYTELRYLLKMIYSASGNFMKSKMYLIINRLKVYYYNIMISMSECQLYLI